MNAAETITAAIDKLEQLREWATPGPWFRVYGDVVTSHDDPFDLSDEPAPERVVKSNHALRDPRGIANAELILTLHRTIDAQLAILRDAFDDLQPGWAGMRQPDENYELQTALARAVLGVES